MQHVAVVPPPPPTIAHLLEALLEQVTGSLISIVPNLVIPQYLFKKWTPFESYQRALDKLWVAP